MAQMSRDSFKGIHWTINSEDGKSVLNVNEAMLAVLMDLRDELQTLKNIFQYGELSHMSQILREIRRNTKKRKLIRKITVRRKFHGKSRRSNSKTQRRNCSAKK